jgi:peptide-methionine (S)-S-oxide reductase
MPKASLRIVALLLIFFSAIFSCRAGSVHDIPAPAVDESKAPSPRKELAFFAGGCFWGVQAVFQHVKGVVKVTSGYSGGTLKNPGYEEVSSGTTGHAESVEVLYDGSQVTYGDLLRIFFSVAHDPTELNRQGPDEGTQYRSAIFYSTDEQKHIAQAYIAQLDQAKVFPKPIVTQVVALTAFYNAEDYHQNYAELHPDNPYILYNDAPKVANLKKEFPQLYMK